VSIASADSSDRNFCDGITPVSLGRVQIPDAVDPGVDMDEPFSVSGLPAAAGPAALREERPRNGRTELVVPLAARVVGGRREAPRLVTARAGDTMEREEAVVGGDQHRGDTQVIEAGAPLDRHRDRGPRAQQT